MPFLSLPDFDLHYRTVAGDPSLPWLVFLHEGLGSVELWRDFPLAVAEKSGHRALIYSRFGHGWSTPLTGPRPVEFMHREALVVLPAVLEQLSIDSPILVGHSDGASIALIHASRFPVTATVAMAPHVFVEAHSLDGIVAAGRAFAETDLAERMAKYHRDPVATFRGWHDTWMDPAFESWNIKEVLAAIRRPLLLVQGADDEYGTEAQLAAIEQGVTGEVERLWLEGCGHSPHLDRPEAVSEAVVAFLARYTGVPHD